MALEKYKVCPACGEHNAPRLLECRKCETDLTGIKVVDAASEQKAVKVEKEEPVSKALYRVCDCGENNPPQARVCRACGEDISDILPTMQEAKVEQSFQYRLEAIGSDFTATFEAPVVVIGREAEMSDYLGNKMFVSRQHAKLTIAAGKVFIENLSKTNKTFVNNELVSEDKPVSLTNGDELGLGGKVIAGDRQERAGYFIFRCQA